MRARSTITTFGRPQVAEAKSSTVRILLLLRTYVMMIPDVARHQPATHFTAVLPSPLGTTELVVPMYRGEGAVHLVCKETHHSRRMYFSSQCTDELAAPGVSGSRPPSGTAETQLPLEVSKVTPHVPRDCSLCTGACLPQTSISRLRVFIFHRVGRTQRTEVLSSRQGGCLGTVCRDCKPASGPQLASLVHNRFPPGASYIPVYQYSIEEDSSGNLINLGELVTKKLRCISYGGRVFPGHRPNRGGC